MILRKVLVLIIALGFINSVASAQILQPVKWKTETKSVGKNQYDIIFTATIDDGWHVYSQFLKDDGPIPTSFHFDESKDYKLIGKTTESGNKKESYDAMFSMQLIWFESKAVFTQRVEVLSPTAVVKGYYEYETCNDRSCLPPEDVDFNFELKGSNTGTVTPPNNNVPVETNTNTISNGSSDCDCVQKAIDSLLKSGVNFSNNSNNGSVTTTAAEEVFVPIDTAGFKADNNNAGTPQKDSSNWWLVFLKGFIGGLLALLTPCVFPMIPLTVSFFLKRSSTRQKGIRNAIIYGLSIIIIYILIGFLVTLIMGPNGLNQLSTNAIFNLVFFLVFVIFALSFFGAFEITLPSSWINKSESMSDKGGLIGIFFMAFTLALVSFSCTGPIIGTVLVEAAVGGNYAGPLLVMTGFSTALALPFALFAMFPQLLQSLPKSGGWLNTVKVTIGFIELALSLKFLSVPDLTYHWHILDREVFLVLWIVIFILLGVYLLGAIKFSHDSDVPHVTIPRLFFSITTFAFAVYLIPGLWGAPLKVIAGFSPPKGTQDFDLFEAAHQAQEKNTQQKKYADIFHAPPGINAWFDYNQAMAVGKKEGKPVMIDFTGWGCVNCRKMEEYIWSDPEVSEVLNEKYILVSLYVDDRTPLPPSEQYVSKVTGKMIRTLGNKLADFETTYLKANSQPYYVLLNNDGKLLAPASGSNFDKASYLQWLNQGLETYKKLNSK